jgi:hypothetical protein
MDTQQQNMGTPQTQGFLKQMESFFNTYLHQKAPFHLPPKAKEWIVRFGPWITLIIMILALPAILALIGLTAFFTPAIVVYGAGYHNLFLIEGLIALLALVMQAAALPGLFARKLSAWHLVYYSVLVSAVGQLLGGNIIALIIDVIISMYFLFEIREYYK